MIFFTTIFCSLKAPIKALIGFGRCYIPTTDSPSCSKPKSLRTISMCQLQANSWKYTFEDDGLFTPCHSNMEGTEGVKEKRSYLES